MLLAENKIGIFAVSTYNTDYIFTKEENFEKAINVLENNEQDLIEGTKLKTSYWYFRNFLERCYPEFLIVFLKNIISAN